MEEERVYGTLYIVGKEGSRLPFPIDKKQILLGRDPSCDIRIVNKEISRKHAEVYVDDETGACMISSMGREPVRVNGKPVETPQELFTGDHIEVLLDGRTREFVFEGEDDTVEVPRARRPLSQVTNSSNMQPSAVLAKAAPPAGKPGPPPPPPPPAVAARKPEAAASAGMPSALQEAIKAGIKLKKVNPENKPAPKATAAPAAFVPNPADLLKLRAGLRKTDKSGVEAQKQQEEAPESAQQAASAAAQAPAAAPAKEAVQEAAAAQQEPAAAEETAATEVQQHQLSAPTAEEQNALEEAPGAEAAIELAAAEEALAMGAAGGAEQEGPAAPEEGAVPMDTADGEQQPQQEKAQEENVAEAAGAGPAECAGEAAAGATQPHTARKRVRFVEGEAATPEGAMRDATMTIHLRKGDMRQVVNVEADNTVAFSQWALGSLEEEAEEQLPATVTVKKSHRESTLTAPSSAGKTPMHSALRSLFGDHTMMVKLSPPLGSAIKGITPGGMLAPAPTPVTGAMSAQPQWDTSVIDASTLAAKLLEMAKENDVTLELPADAAVSLGKEAFKVVLTPRSTSKHGAAQGPESGPKAGPSTAGKSRLSQMGATIEEDAAEISFKTVAVEEKESTPVLAPASVRQPARQTPRTAQKQQPATEQAAAAAPASTPRSASRTPRVVIIERSSTPGTTAANRSMVDKSALKSAAKSVGKSAAKSGQKPAAEEAIVAEEEGLAPAAAASPGTQITPRQLSTVGMQMQGEDSGEDVDQQPAGGNCMDVEEEVAPASVPLKLYQKTLLKAKAYRAQAAQLQTQLRRMAGKVAKLSKAATAVGQALDEERAKRLELQAAMRQIVINREARQVAAKAEEQQEVEGGGELVVFEVDGKAVPMEEEAAVAEEEEPMLYMPKVVVVRPTGCPSPSVEDKTEQAGCVVVVRPQQPAAAPADEPATASKVPATTPRVVVVASTRKSPAHRASVAPEPSTAEKAQAAGAKTPATAVPKSILKTTGKSAVVDKLVAKLVVDQVQLPDWLFAGQEGEGADADGGAAAELAAAVQDAAAMLGEQAEAASAEEQQGEAALGVDDATEQALADAGEEAAVLAHSLLQTQVMEVDVEVHQVTQAEPGAGESGDEEEEEDNDVCYLCGKSEDGDVLLLCDSCDNACHLTCCNPPLKRVPKGDWFCVPCAAKQAPAAEVARSAKKLTKQEDPQPEPAKRGSKRPAPAAATAEKEPVAQHAAAAPKPGRGRRASVAPARSQPAAEPALEAGEEQAAAKPSRSRRASEAPASSQPAVLQEAEQPVAKPGRRRRASVAPSANQVAAVAEEAEEEQGNAAARPSRGRMASMAAAPAQTAGAKRGRSANALDAIVEEESSEGEQEDQAAEEAAVVPQVKRQRAARGAKQEAPAEPASTRTTRTTRGSKQEEHEVEGPASRRGRAKAEPAAAGAKATRTTRSKR